MGDLSRSVSVHVDAPPQKVYEMVADVTRMGEWSPENLGGTWIGGAGGPTVGAQFRAKNKRKAGWSTTCTVIAAEPGREFAFDVGKAPATRWRDRFEPAGGGTDVTESFEIVREPGFIGRFFTKMGTGVTWDERPADMENGMRQTLERLKAAAEAG